MACYNFDKHKPIVLLFGRYVADKVSNQKLLYFATSPNHSVSALPCKTLKRKNRTCYSNAVLLHCQSCYLQLVLMLLYDSLNLVVSGVKHSTVSWVIAQKKMKLTVLHCTSWTALNTMMRWCTVLLKDNIVISNAF